MLRKPFNPVATYRLQLHKDFNLQVLKDIVPYLHRLGVVSIYASPLFRAVPGSLHGYDATDPLAVNPEIGTPEQLKEIRAQLHALGMGWVQDIVPNHMAFHHDNHWLMDVLEQGEQSPCARFFDIDWDHPYCPGRILAPFLGTTLQSAIDEGSLAVVYQEQRFWLQYHDARYPICPASWSVFLQPSTGSIPDDTEQVSRSIRSLFAAKGLEELHAQLAALMEDTATSSYIADSLQRINKDAALLRRICDEQFYLLCHWSESDRVINYRRFFTVNSLICLNMQDAQVFRSFHAHLVPLVNKGTFNGLRIDHIDGLADPAGYLAQLRDACGPDTYLNVEKILAAQEPLPPCWPVQGTTGYDFLAMVNNLLTDGRSEKALTAYYNALTGDARPLAQQLAEKKVNILSANMQGELDNLLRLFASRFPPDNAAAEQTLRQAIGLFLVYCPVYRYYGQVFPLPEDEAAKVTAILDTIRSKHPELGTAVSKLKEALLVLPARSGEDAANAALFYRRCLQYTGPLMAKGMEDTLLYTYNRFIGHNEVGDSPGFFGLDVASFHRLMKERQEQWPLSVNATATHDTKRGEDVRARLNVLTALEDEWIAQVRRWQTNNAVLKENGLPDANDEYFIYQTLAGAYPMPGVNAGDFEKRLEEYLPKALREAKVHSDWAAPDESYEAATRAFAKRLLDPESAFCRELREWVQRTADHGIVNSLVQLILKCTCPGLPDIYQGCELWDLSLVDPDNRRPVDYAKRKSMSAILDEKADAALCRRLWGERYSGIIKLWLTGLLLQERKTAEDLFRDGTYLPLKVTGRHRRHVLAFARCQGNVWYLVAVPLYTARLCRQQAIEDPCAIDWADTGVQLPDDAPPAWRHLLSSVRGHAGRNLLVKDIFDPLPLAVLRMEPGSDRSAGVLLHITSLPGRFGIGDLGPSAHAFADFLRGSCQKVWQLLPFNPISKESDYSPYSSVATMAGNIFLISPELLADDGLLTIDELESAALPEEAVVDYESAMRSKQQLLDKAYDRFRTGGDVDLQEQLDHFCKAEKWLDDYALYVSLKEAHNDDPWFLWEPSFRHRDPQSLSLFARTHRERIERTKWQQFIFSRQWNALKMYCNQKGIRLFGDLPFYVSYDSADVWVHPDIFCLDSEAGLKGIAGVPPDYFSRDGQLWGMPTFNWEQLQRNNYDWWIERLRKSLERFDLLRIDHFRALAAYWEVPAGEPTARNGTWKKGPGMDFFRTLKAQLGTLPFVAEDLGDDMDDVYALRDEAGLPGMKVLQFAFGSYVAQSVDAPHNYNRNCCVYTGTHDNNTAVGWYHDETGRADHKRLEKYAGTRVTAGNIHRVLARMAYASVADTAVIPMQDLLGSGAETRMNTPGTAEGNWRWRLHPGDLNDRLRRQMRSWARMYNRW